MTRGRARPATMLGLGMVLAALVAVVALGAPGAIVYYVTPTEMAADPTDRPVRLYGVVESGSVRWEEGAGELRFTVTDGQTAVAVRTSAIPTALFRDGVAVVLAGRRESATSFLADELLVKHSEVYAPLAPGQTIPPGLLETVIEPSP
ncbi:MAG: cytochrome c maturation protein CcmE [Candidatus Limnocylindrales bacterium]